MSGPVHTSFRTILLVIGALLLAPGLFWLLLSRYLGNLPGDVVVRRQGWTFAFPIVSCLLLSVAVSLLLWLVRR